MFNLIKIRSKWQIPLAERATGTSTNPELFGIFLINLEIKLATICDLITG